MGGVTPHGIRYPDGASKAKNLGPELKTMAEDIDGVFTDTTEGSVIHEAVEEVAQEVVPPLIEELVDEALDDYVEQPVRIASRNYEVPFIDETDRVLGGAYEDGRVEFVKPEGVLPSKARWSSLDDYVPLTSEDGYIFGKVFHDGRVLFPKLVSDGGDIGGGVAADRFEALVPSRRDKIVCVGDSLTAGYGPDVWPPEDTWPYKLGALNTKATVLNRGLSGRTVDEIALHLGALPLTIATGVTVPASGSVALSVQSGVGWRTGRDRDFPGTLDGIPGVLSRVATDAGTVVHFAATGLSSSRFVAAGARFIGEWADARDGLFIIGAGRNDVSYDVLGSEGSIAKHVIAGLKRIVEWMQAGRRRFLIWGTENSSSERAGSYEYALVQEINEWCRVTYPGNWIDIRWWLVNQAIHDLGITPTAGDTAAMNGDAPPPSIMVPGDKIHFSKTTAAALAPVIDRELARHEWKVT